MKPLIEKGMVYIAQPPLYRVYKKSDPSKHIYCWDDDKLEEAKEKIGAGYGINRYKGLGEMNADQLAATTMNKKSRLLLQVHIDDPLVVEKRIGVLMGKDSQQRGTGFRKTSTSTWSILRKRSQRQITMAKKEKEIIKETSRDGLAR
jgi:topoisomerase-4 subunit B